MSRPEVAKASRAGVVQGAACGAGASRRLALDKDEHGASLGQAGPGVRPAATGTSGAAAGSGLSSSVAKPSIINLRAI